MPPKRTAKKQDAPRAEITFGSDWREQQQGDITAGGSLVVHYEPSRLTNGDGVNGDGAPLDEIVGFARFLPGGQLRHTRLAWRTGSRRGKDGRFVRVPIGTEVAGEIDVPPETSHVELWFQAVRASGETRWDSRFGANYRFDVVPPSPPPDALVAPRPDAVVDASVIRVADDAAVKTNAFASRPGQPRAALSLQTSLRVAARVDLAALGVAADALAATRAWIDVHAFDGDAPVRALVKAETRELRHAGVTADGGALFVLDDLLYQGSVATPGSVQPRPDLRTVHYRLYCEAQGRAYTDGVLHQCFLATDPLAR